MKVQPSISRHRSKRRTAPAKPKRKTGTKTPKTIKTPYKSNAEPSGIWHHLQTWATESDMDPETLKKQLTKLDYKFIPGEKIPFKVIRAALFGEMEVEKLREVKLKNDDLERKAAAEKRVLVPMADLEPRLSEYTIIIGGLLNSLPTSLDTRCNPTDPELSRRALEDWLERTFKPQLRTASEKIFKA